MTPERKRGGRTRKKILVKRSHWIIVGFSLLVHLPGITSPLLDYHAHRQTQTASMSRNFVRHGMNFFQPMLDARGRPQRAETEFQPMLDASGRPKRAETEFPLYSYLVAVLYRVFGTHDIIGRLVSCMFAAWGAVFLYRLVRIRLSEPIALLSALVMCVIPVHVYFTRTFQPEAMALWGFLGFVFYWDRWLFRERSLRDLVLATLLGAIGPLLKLNFLYLVMLVGPWMVFERYGWRALKRPQNGLPFAGILLATWGWYHYTQTAPTNVLPLGWAEHWENIKVIGTWQLWRNHFVSRFPEICSTYTGLLLGIIGVRHLVTVRSAARGFAPSFWFFWFGATAAYQVLLGEYGLIHKYTMLPFAPINAVFIAMGIRVMWNRFHTSPQGIVIMVLLVLAMPAHAALRIKHWYRVEREYLWRAKEVLDRVSDPKDLVVTQTRETAVLHYYLDRYGYVIEFEHAPVETVDRFQSLGAKYFLTPTTEGWQDHPEWAEAMAKQATVVHEDPEFLLYRLK